MGESFLIQSKKSLKPITIDEGIINQGTFTTKHGSVEVIPKGKISDSAGIKITGSVKREVGSERIIGDYIGWYIDLDISKYEEISFSYKKENDHGNVNVLITLPEEDSFENVIVSFSEGYKKLDSEWKNKAIDISGLKGVHRVRFLGGYVDKTGNLDSQTLYTDIKFLY